MTHNLMNIIPNRNNSHLHQANKKVLYNSPLNVKNNKKNNKAIVLNNYLNLNTKNKDTQNNPKKNNNKAMDSKTKVTAHKVIVDNDIHFILLFYYSIILFNKSALFN
jgi:hypothetical protein